MLHALLVHLHHLVLLLLHAVEHCGLLLLPHEHVVHHGAAAEENSNPDEDARDDRRRRVELRERVQNYTWNGRGERA